MTRAPFVNAIVGTGGPATGVKSVRTIEAEFEHERAVLLLDVKEPTSKRFASGAPVLIEWGFKPAPHRFFIGYVNHAEPIHRPASSSERGGDRLLKVVCVAPSWVTKEEGFASFRNVSYTQAVKALGESLRFGVANVAPTARTEAALHQGGRSAWAFMVDCAKKAGFTLFTRGMQLHCRDRRDLITAGSAKAVWIPSSSITEMGPVLGASSPEGDLARRDVFTVNPRSGGVLGLSNAGTSKPALVGTGTAPGFAKARTTLAVADIGEATARLEAEERLSRMSTVARLEAASHPMARVGAVAVITGRGADADGYWYIAEAEHEFSGAHQRTMTLKLLRDTTTAALAPRTPPTSVASANRTARLLNGRWVL